MTAVAFKSNEENKVLDLGGAAGIHYFLTKKAFDADTTFKWCVVETNKMVFENKGSENSELTFRTSIEEAKKLLESIDLIHVGGSIQYFSDPIQVLRQLVKLDSTWIIFFRTPLSESKTRIVKQSSKIGDNGPGHLENRNKNKIVSYPVTFVPRKLFEEIVSEYYEILYYFKENEYSNVNGELIELFGYVCKKLKNGVRRD
jgi:putative methyltransferase (TIGR04325 family)